MLQITLEFLGVYKPLGLVTAQATAAVTGEGHDDARQVFV